MEFLNGNYLERRGEDHYEPAGENRGRESMIYGGLAFFVPEEKEV